MDSLTEHAQRLLPIHRCLLRIGHLFRFEIKSNVIHWTIFCVWVTLKVRLNGGMSMSRLRHVDGHMEGVRTVGSKAAEFRVT